MKLNRRFQQPHALLLDFYRGTAIQVRGHGTGDFGPGSFLRASETEEFFLRIDPGIAPTCCSVAQDISEAELGLLRRTRGDVLSRLGHVRRIERDEIVLDEGRVPTSEGTVHRPLQRRGIRRPPLRPIFEP